MGGWVGDGEKGGGKGGEGGKGGKEGRGGEALVIALDKIWWKG